jgi:hypothetical protein
MPILERAAMSMVYPGEAKDRRKSKTKRREEMKGGEGGGG